MGNLVLFDLDGTLVDTAPDLGLALNLQRKRHGLPFLDQDIIRPYASHGSKGLLAIGFNITPEDANFAAMRDEYLALYEEVYTRTPMLFEGMETLLQRMESAGLRWGIVTNKPRRFSAPLLAALKLEQRMACLVCADDVPRAKPHPDSLLAACEQAGVLPEVCIYIGDAQRDIAAGIAAGMPTVAALYGYLDQADRPLEWGADYVVHEVAEIETCLVAWQQRLADRCEEH
ncbi:HAD family hydrolase [Methylobacillus flagellatus]|uniref:phosphoglycolate phosphatase n=1 Tax=Methylobacillus flagellatus (strain ATCC 51484 / DSM 6875 / VKM B-1610 / KT) TaxID=265072 RepID=Q1H0Z4_METFK|nr:HAD-IA family hydrolase [Methylobacillus flagellatus]ABE49843.1 phosphoglycolate phosphatase [Methylobacillus flagellatus KT]